METNTKKICGKYLEVEITGDSALDAGRTTISTGTMDLLDAICAREQLKSALDDIDIFIHEKAAQSEGKQ